MEHSKFFQNLLSWQDLEIWRQIREENALTVRFRLLAGKDQDARDRILMVIAVSLFSLLQVQRKRVQMHDKTVCLLLDKFPDIIFSSRRE